MRPSFRLAGSLFFIVMLLGILFSYAMFQGGFTSWFLFYSFLPILLYPLGLAVYPIRKWDVTREVTPQVDRKSTRLNSSHVSISYAVYRFLHSFPTRRSSDLSFRLAGSLFFIVMLLGILFSYAMFQGGFTSWFLFYSFLPILLYPLGLAVYPIRKWDVTREVTPQ